MFYAPHPGRFPGEHSSNALGHAPKVARLTTVTTVLENLRKFSNYTLQVCSTVIFMQSNLLKCVVSCTRKKVIIRFHVNIYLIRCSHLRRLEMDSYPGLFLVLLIVMVSIIIVFTWSAIQHSLFHQLIVVKGV